MRTRSKRRRAYNEACPCGSGKKYRRCCLRKEAEETTRYTAQDRMNALGLMEAFWAGPGWREERRLSLDEFWSEPDAEPAAEISRDLVQVSFEAWRWYFMCDYELASGQQVIDAFLDAAPNVPIGVRAYLHRARASVMRLYEVTEVWPGQGLTLREVVTGEQVPVVEKQASMEIRRWDMIAARVIGGGDGDLVLDGPVLPIRQDAQEPVVAQLREGLEGLEGAELTARYREYCPALHQVWIEPAKLPTLVNYDGDPLVIHRLKFSVHDAEKVARAFDGARALDREDEAETRWIWSGKGKQRKEAVTLGGMSIDARGDLELVTNSAERAKRGRRMVERLAGAAIAYRTMVIEDPAAMMNAPNANAVEGDPPTPELQNLLIVAAEDKLAEHYEAWVDESVPRLEHESPRTAARNTELRPRVVKMLKELEAHYERSLDQGEPAFDPSWLWVELGLQSDRDSPSNRRQPPRLGHEALKNFFPGLDELAGEVAKRVRKQDGSTWVEAVDAAQMSNDLRFRRLQKESHSPELLSCSAELLCNFELYYHKVFWVDEPLAWLLGATKLDVLGEAVRAPFASFALTLTDRYSLGLAERALARLPPDLRRARMLQVLTVYVTTSSVSDTTRLCDVKAVGDAMDGTCPAVIPCRFEISDEQRITEALDAVVAGTGVEDVEEALPVFSSTPLRGLLELVVNAMLYATSADVEVEELAPSKPSTQRQPPARKAPLFTSETVFFLPGKIDIGAARQVQRTRFGGKGAEQARRCMVRGHWRRAHESWSDQRPRWIKPHWRGPSAAAIVEREGYRLKSR